MKPEPERHIQVFVSYTETGEALLADVFALELDPLSLEVTRKDATPAEMQRALTEWRFKGRRIHRDTVTSRNLSAFAALNG